MNARYGGKAQERGRFAAPQRVRSRALAWLTVLVWAGSGSGLGQITTYNISAFDVGVPATDAAARAAFMSALGAAGYATFSEDFTDPVWDAARSSVVGGTVAVASIANQGITWHSSFGDFITTSVDSSGVAPWHIYSIGGSVQEPLHAVPDTLFGQSSQVLYGLGFWISGGPPEKGKLNVILDGTRVVKFEQIIGYDSSSPPEPIKETLRLSSHKRFYGLMDPQGFTQYQLLEIEGVPEDQVLMWTTAYTVAFVPEPSATLGTAAGLVVFGCAAARRRRI